MRPWNFELVMINEYTIRLQSFRLVLLYTHGSLSFK
jgi:hypothetical protein